MANRVGHARQVDRVSAAFGFRQVVIGMAVGLSMDRYQIDRDRAFQFLVRASSRGQLKVHDIAHEVVETPEATYRAQAGSTAKGPTVPEPLGEVPTARQAGEHEEPILIDVSDPHWMDHVTAGMGAEGSHIHTRAGVGGTIWCTLESPCARSRSVTELLD